MELLQVARIRIMKIAEIEGDLKNKPTGYGPEDTIGDYSFSRKLDMFSRIGITREQMILLLDDEIKGDISTMKEVMSYSRIHIVQNAQLLKDFSRTIASVNCLKADAVPAPNIFTSLKLVEVKKPPQEVTTDPNEQNTDPPPPKDDEEKKKTYKEKCESLKGYSDMKMAKFVNEKKENFDSLKASVTD